MDTKIRCVTYVPKYSAGKSALRDLEIGIEHGVVGCGSKVFNSSNSGDYVIINATKNKIKYVVIGVLIDKIDSCERWAIEGGRTWPYNWTYRPLTNRFIYDNLTKTEIHQYAEANSLNANNLFNSRFCSKKMRPLVDILINKFR